MQKKAKNYITAPSLPFTKDVRAPSQQKPLLVQKQKQTRSKKGYSGKFTLKDMSKKSSSQQIPSHLTPSTRRLASDKIKKIRNFIQNQKSLSYDQTCKQFRQLIKDDLEYYGFTVDHAKSQIGRAMLNDGAFYVVFSKINFRSEFVVREMYLKNLKIKYLPKVTENKNMLLEFIQQQQLTLEQQKKIRQLQLRNKLKISQQVDIFGYSSLNSEQLKKQSHISRQQKIQLIKKNQSYLIDFFQINDVYDDQMIQIIGIIDQIDDQYAIMLVKEIKEDQNEENKDNGKNKKQARQVLAIGLMKNIQNNQHKKQKLKEIQKKHPNIFAYVQVDNPQTVFFNALPDESVKSNSMKKQNLNITQSFTLNFSKNKW